ncbi:hypothetical protein LRS10_13680 [Phenylobacterium sp. J426]|uniref:DNA methyltransferase n=1 Tax=Phenylobacterium sp. J426 TaxID=2898439 RepID=UPI002150C584|nr:DNA methyltransferase [Phenylobacterium sp. J426]MCR5875144.1 hypothetical protein [Phenylobacterium sp. J426]
MAEDAYTEFLAGKAIAAPTSGFHVDQADLHPWLKPHCKAIVQWGLAGGCRAYFTAYGLHKTSMQLESGRQVLLHQGGEGLIVAPLGVRQEFFDDAATMGIELVFIQSDAEIQPGKLHLTNYESVREGKVTPGRFVFASLDEADVLRSYGSKTFQEFLPAFEGVPFKFVATATPSPNRYKELIHYAGFLGVMDTGQALTRFFQRNSEKANDLTLYPHKEAEFWLWVSTWAVFLQKPSDLGFSDDGYQLPEIEVRWHEVQADLADAGADSRGQLKLIRDAAVGVQDAAREKRATLGARIAKMKELRDAEPDNHFILWHDLEDERRAIEEAIPAAQSVYGSQDLDAREEIVRGFKNGTVTDLAAKPVMLGAGGNLQRHCHRMIFAGIGHKFRDFAQAIHRIQRFGQQHRVVVDIVYAETEREIRRDLEAKWARDTELRERMGELIRRYGLNNVSPVEAMRRSIGVERHEQRGETWTAVHNDCVDEVRRMESDSVGLILTSIPFGTQYEYCESYNDFGHNDDNAAFFRQMDFLSPELLRILKPGRLMAVHVKDRILFGNVTGLSFPTLEPFHSDCIDHFRRHGFHLLAVRVVETDVVRENNQTYRLGYSEMRKDASRMGSGCPEFVLFFRKAQSDLSRGYADDPVAKALDEYSLARWQVDAAAYWRSSGDRLLTADELAQLPAKTLSRAFREWSKSAVYDHDAHVRLAEALAARGALPKTYSALALESPSGEVWTDIVRMRTLNNEQSLGNREKHVCPLQIDLVDRIVRLYSAKGDLVFDPFMGIGTVPVRAVAAGRRAYGSELEPKYFRDAVRYLLAAEFDARQPTLFDVLDVGAKAA